MTHIIHIAEMLNPLLPPGYVAAPEQSFQVNAITAEELPQRRLKIAKPDVTVYGDTGLLRSSGGQFMRLPQR